MANTVSAEWLHERLNHTEIVIADCRFLLGKPAAGKEAYEAGHLPGAVYFDLEQDLSDVIGVPRRQASFAGYESIVSEAWRCGNR